MEQRRKSDKLWEAGKREVKEMCEVRVLRGYPFDNDDASSSAKRI